MARKWPLRRPLLRSALFVLVVTALGACGAGSAPTDRAADDTVPAATTTIVGSPTELLPELAFELSRLSAQIGGDGDERATLERIDAIWAAIGPQIQVSRPDLQDQIETTVVLADSAVNRNRPADADKAYSLLTNLLGNYANTD